MTALSAAEVWMLSDDLYDAASYDDENDEWTMTPDAALEVVIHVMANRSLYGGKVSHYEEIIEAGNTPGWITELMKAATQ